MAGVESASSSSASTSESESDVVRCRLHPCWVDEEAVHMARRVRCGVWVMEELDGVYAGTFRGMHKVILDVPLQCDWCDEFFTILLLPDEFDLFIQWHGL